MNIFFVETYIGILYRRIISICLRRKKLWDHSTGNTMTVNFNSKTSDEGGIFSCSVITRTRVPSNSALTTQLSIPSTTPQPICKCGNRPSLSLKIVGGQRASIVDWPWTVMIRDVIPFGVGEQFCGGTLISSSWVITAAHCTENRNANTMIAFIGQTNIDISTPSTQVWWNQDLHFYRQAKVNQIFLYQ